MDRLPYFEHKYDVFIASILISSNHQSEIVSGLNDYNSVITHWNLEVIDATRENTHFSYQVDDRFWEWIDSMSTVSSIYLHTSAIYQSTTKTLSQDINSFKYSAYLIQISNEQLAHFICATHL